MENAANGGLINGSGHKHLDAVNGTKKRVKRRALEA